jgi:uncharacterized protein
MFVPRAIYPALESLRQYYPIVYLGGPRQAGKTTLLRHFYSDLPYVNLEDPEVRLLAEQDPRRFLSRYPNGAILDEVQRVPHLFSYLQVLVDEDRSRKFVLSGSQNFLLMERITQSLAGRVGILNLLPFSFEELLPTEYAPASLDQFAWQGGFPGLFDPKTPPDIFFGNYLQTYLERDVRMLKNVGDLTLFTRFLRLCAGRVGQPLNLSTLATDLGLSVNTVKAWMSVLEASYLIFYVAPFHQNFNKRIIKAPKFYFFDTGLLCYLLGIATPAQLGTHHYYGNIIENALIANWYKKRTNAGQRPVFWFWQDQQGNEVDLIIEEQGQLKAIEIKSSQTFNTRLTSGLKRWAALSAELHPNNFLVYAGDQSTPLEQGELLPWYEGLKKL